jgi:NAD dependent epimerase/dehydratase
MAKTWSKTKVLVTGAGGFIGSHLTEALVELGCEVTAMIRYSSRSDWGSLEFLSEDKKSALRVVAGAVEDSYFVSRHVRGKDVVFHLAALIGIPYSYIAPNSYIRTNIIGTTNVLESAREFDVSRVVHTSTSEIYGTAKYIPIDEKHPIQPQSPYSASKVGADMIAESFYRAFGTPVAIMRPFNTYGPRQSARAVIPTIISQVVGASSEIQLGSVSPIRDLSFVKDTVRAFLKMAENDDAVGKIINIGAGRGITIHDLAKLVLEMTQVDKPIVEDAMRKRPSNSEVFELIADNSRAEQILGWKPHYTLEQGLSETINFISKNLHLFKIGQYAL